MPLRGASEHPVVSEGGPAAAPHRAPSSHKRIPDLQLLLDRHGVVHQGQDPFLQTGGEKIVQKFDGARTYLLRSPEVESPVSIADILGGVEQLQQTEDSMYRLAVLAALLLLGWRFVSPLSWVSLRSREPSSPEQAVGLADLTKNGRPGLGNCSRCRVKITGGRGRRAAMTQFKRLRKAASCADWRYAL